MQPKREPPIFRRQQSAEDPQEERRRLLAQIEEKKKILNTTEFKLNHYKRQCKKMMQSNDRNIKRMMRYRAKLEQLYKHRNQPEHFLYMCGFMNEYMQEFMLCHNVGSVEIEGEPNPDNMSYQQLLELGQSIGKVSKGISKEQFYSLKRSNKIKEDQSCPICCTEFSMGETAVILKCKHAYHQQCICEWLKDENTCPICKQHVLE